MGEMPVNGCASYAGGMVDVVIFVNSRMLSEDGGKVSCAADLLARDYTWKHGDCRWWWPRVLGHVAALSSSCDWVECIGVIIRIDQL